MGMIASDLWAGLLPDGGELLYEAEYTGAELLSMAGEELQCRWEDWASENGQSSYLPFPILAELLEDEVFFGALLDITETGENVVLSGARIACTRGHLKQMGLSEADAQDDLLRSMAREQELTESVRWSLAGDERVSGLYLFANGWLGLETVHPVEEYESAFGEAEETQGFMPGEGETEPSLSYLFSEEGELIASPDIRGSAEEWMRFVDMFSSVSEEASASDAGRGRAGGSEDRPGTAAARKGQRDAAEDDGEYLVYTPEVRAAMEQGRPVVVIESAATFTGMMYPGIAAFAHRMQETVREHGAVPAYTAIIGGKIHVGLTDEEILYLEERRGSVFKASARDIPVLLAMGADGVMTIAAAVRTAAMAGLHVACASGIGGAQIGAAQTMDISTDLEMLAEEPVMVVCSGPKPVLDLYLTMEYLETVGVPVIGYRTDRMPDYLVRGTDLRLNYRMEEPAELARVMRIKDRMHIPGGVLVVNPVPHENAQDAQRMREAVDRATEDVRRNNVRGKAMTGYLMGRLKAYMGEESMESQKAFLLSNAALAAEIAAAGA